MAYDSTIHPCLPAHAPLPSPSDVLPHATIISWLRKGTGDRTEEAAPSCSLFLSESGKEEKEVSRRRAQGRKGHLVYQEIWPGDLDLARLVYGGNGGSKCANFHISICKTLGAFASKPGPSVRLTKANQPRQQLGGSPPPPVYPLSSAYAAWIRKPSTPWIRKKEAKLLQPLACLLSCATPSSFSTPGTWRRGMLAHHQARRGAALGTPPPMQRVGA